MNLAKKSTILLAALGALTLASCNNSSTKKLGYDEAIKWVSEHYTKDQSRTITHCNVAWDYTKNVETGETPNEGLWAKFQIGGKKLNFFFEYSLNSEFDVKSEDIKSKKGNADVKGTSTFGSDDIIKQTLIVDRFKKEFNEDNSFEAKGNNLIVKKSRDYSDKGREVIEGLRIYFYEVDTYTFDKDGYLSKMEVAMTANDTKIALLNGETEVESVKLGELNSTITTSPLV